MVMLRVGIIGGRLAGSRLAGLLAARGIEVRLFDHRTDREKACGGGMTFRAYRGLPQLEEEAPACSVSRMKLLSSRHPGGITTPLNPPLRIYSRQQLDSRLRDLAVRAGAQWIQEKVVDIAYAGGEWTIRTSRGRHQCDFLAGADGVRSLLKCRLDRPLPRHDLALALGYYVPGAFHPDTIHCRFFDPPFQGYLWAFPRPDHLSVGILNRFDLADPRAMRRQVESHLRRHYPEIQPERCREYAAPVPALSTASLRSLVVGGEHWAVIGDAAGFADPITGEGIYYALRSAELLADCLVQGAPESYSTCCRQAIVPELMRAARWKKAFYTGMAGHFPLHRAALGLAARSARFASIISDWTAGTAPYADIPGRFFRELPQIARELLGW